jgi:hypothetical protein
MLTDLSGMTTTTNSLLEESACKLRNAFQDSLRDYFGVYDFGFYIQTENMGGESEIDDIFQEMESRITHPYYLIFGRKSSPDGIFTKLFVKFNFPVGVGIYHCIYEEDLQSYKEYLPAFLAEKFNQLNNDPSQADFAINSIIIEFENFVIKKNECCAPGFTNSCNLLLSAEEIEKTLLNDGFLRIIDKVNSATTINNTEKTYLHEFAAISTSSMNLNQKLNEFLLSVNNVFLNSYAELHIVNPSNYASKKAEINSLFGSDNFLRMAILALEISPNKFQLLIKWRFAEFKGEKKSIWLIGLPGHGITLSNAKTELAKYLKLINCNSNVSIKTLNVTDVNKINVTEFNKEDKLIFISPEYQTALLLFRNNTILCPMRSEFFDGSLFGQMEIETGKNKSSTLSVEIADPKLPTMVGVIKSSIIPEYKTNYNAESNEDLVGWLSIHIIGHHAMGEHDDFFGTVHENLDCDLNYWMASGKYIHWILSNYVNEYGQLRFSTLKKFCDIKYWQTQTYAGGPLLDQKSMDKFKGINELVCSSLGQ